MAAETNLEREFKFDVDPDFDPPDLRPLVGRTERLPEQSLTTTYFDTRDRRLWARGITLRHRLEGEGDGPTAAPGKWTLKLPVAVTVAAPDGGAGAGTARSEVTWKASLAEIPAEARSVVAGLVRRAPLEPVVELRTERRRLLLHDAASGGSGPWGEVDDDLVTVSTGPRAGLRFRQLELELLARDGDEEGGAVGRVLEELRRVGAAPGGGSKFAMAAGLDQTDGHVPARTKRADVPTAVGEILAADLDRLLEWDYRLRVAGSAGDPAALDREVVRRARVATRRLRADIGTLGAVLDPVWVDHVRTDLKWVGSLLGRLRDEDVLADLVRLYGDGTAGAADAEAVEELVVLLGRDRHLGASELCEALDSDRYLDLLDRVHAAVELPPLLDATGGDPSRASLKGTLTDVLASRWAAVHTAMDQLGPEPTDEALHKLRIKAKRLRYAAEAARPYLGKRARRTASAAERLQSVLGELHDASVASRSLREMASHPSVTPTVAFVAGRISGRAESEAARLRRKWGKPARRLAAAKTTGWLR